jgi:sterol desaturase/sphingolipid hydroxylase (fatty acid hydroxylase superfamily)
MKTWLAVTLGFTCLVGLFIVPVIAASMREPLPAGDEMWTFIKERFYNHTIAKNSEKVQLRWDSIGALWETAHQKYQPFYIYVAFYSFVVISYFAAGVFWYFAEQRRWFPKYKLQRKINTNANYMLCLKNICLNWFGVILPLGLLSWPFAGFMGIRFDLPVPTAGAVIYHLAAFFFLEDFFQYWFHRALHIKAIYPYIHKIHHTFQTPFSFATDFAHPVETIILGMATYFPALMLQPHLFTFYCWIVLRQFDGVITHCGHHFPTPLDLLPFYGGTRFHDYHHQSWYYNYASRFTILDKMFGTYKDLPNEEEKSKLN